MPLYEYEAIGADGSRSKGTLDAGAIGIASVALQHRGLEVIRISQAPDLPIKLPPQTKTIGRTPSSTSSEPAPSSRVLWFNASLTEQTFFFKRMQVLMSAGVPLGVALESLERQSQSVDLKSAVHRMRENANAGKPIGEAFDAFPRLFSPITINVVKAGEVGGFLPEAIGHVSEYLDNELELRRLYRELTIKPKLYTAVALLLAPLLFRDLWIFFWAPIIATWITLKLLRLDPKFRTFWDRNVLKVPVVGGISHDFAEAKFGRAFGLLFENGVNVAHAVEIAAEACGNECIRDAIRPAGERLRNGASIHKALLDTAALSPRFIDLLTTGTQTGDVKKMLFRISDDLAAESKHKSTQLAWYVSAILFLWFALVWAAYLIHGPSGGGFQERMRDEGGRMKDEG